MQKRCATQTNTTPHCHFSNERTQSSKTNRDHLFAHHCYHRWINNSDLSSSPAASLALLLPLSQMIYWPSGPLRGPARLSRRDENCMTTRSLQRLEAIIPLSYTGLQKRSLPLLSLSFTLSFSHSLSVLSHSFSVFLFLSLSLWAISWTANWQRAKSAAYELKLSS